MGATRFANDDPAKRAAGYAAVDRYVRDGICVGLGTGTTAYWAIERVGERVARGERIAAVATSSETESLCRELSIPLIEPLAQPMTVAIDGADEVAPDWSLIKGGGGALFREKLIALLAERYIIVVTGEKLVPALGAFPLPVEIVPFAEPYVRREIEVRCKVPAKRRASGNEPFVTDNGNWISTAVSERSPIRRSWTSNSARFMASSRRGFSTASSTRSSRPAPTATFASSAGRRAASTARRR